LLTQFVSFLYVNQKSKKKKTSCFVFLHQVFFLSFLTAKNLKINMDEK